MPRTAAHSDATPERRLSGPATGQWRTHRRDVRAHFEQAYGVAIDALDAVAVMTDCDDSQSRGLAHYGDIYFSSGHAD